MSEQTDKLHAMRHSLAHIMATAIQKQWPEAKFGVGPVVDNGFYYDVDLGEKTLSEDDFDTLETEMNKIIQEDQKFEKTEKNIDEAIEWAKSGNQPYKQELLNDLKRAGTTEAKDIDSEELGVETDEETLVEKVSFYNNGPFTDLCRGPHVESTGKVGAFKLTKVSGAYWRGKDTNPQMQRVYGVAFETKEELEAHLKLLEEAKMHDHRVLGERLKLFFITPDVGAGLPLLMPRGEKIKNILMDYMRNKEENAGYQYVATPVLTQRRLYERSGHADFYLENMYATEEDEEGNQFFIKPMNCPHHHMIYEKLVESYRDLPLRLSEHAGLYRYELSGALTGLIRMRGPITQNDSHTYVTEEDLKQEFASVVDMFKEVYAETGITDYWFRLSLPDFKKDKFAIETDKWEHAATVIRDVLTEKGLDFEEGVGEAAFYGPKLDIQTRNVLGKEDTIATVQLDVIVPERMGLTYVDSDGKEQYPYVIHKSIMGAFERFMAFLLEKTAGNLPVWLSPEQLRLITVNQENETVKFAEKVSKKAKELGVRVETDNSNESVGKKIRAAEVKKVPYSIVIGQKEIESGKATPRTRKDLPDMGEKSIGDILVSIANHGGQNNSNA
ncbi:threonine--tRNA ligase [Candidatus Saccharibacteria bacterium]|nr:threonine--tRNA ligase [Candidatus Saccharibacteria bacterium]